MKERKHRIEDAIAATKAAVEEGTVPGGGAALAQIASVLDGDLGLTGEEAIGVGIVRKALVEPLRWIAQNAGHDGYVVVGKVAELGWGHGLNAATDEYVDLVAAGIIDPVKVTRNAVSNAVVDRRPAAHHGKPRGREAGRRRAGRRWRPQPRRPRPPARPGLLTGSCTERTKGAPLGARLFVFPRAPASGVGVTLPAAAWARRRGGDRVRPWKSGRRMRTGSGRWPRWSGTPGPGRLTLDEFAERARLAHDARTLGDLAAVVRDLPAEAPGGGGADRRDLLISVRDRRR